MEKINSGARPSGTARSSASCARRRRGEGAVLRATPDPAEAYAGADYVVVATPTKYDPNKNFFDTSPLRRAPSTQFVRVNPNA